jgi:hypothetical protein
MLGSTRVWDNAPRTTRAGDFGFANQIARRNSTRDCDFELRPEAGKSRRCAISVWSKAPRLNCRGLQTSAKKFHSGLCSGRTKTLIHRGERQPLVPRQV